MSEVDVNRPFVRCEAINLLHALISRQIEELRARVTDLPVAAFRKNARITEYWSPLGRRNFTWMPYPSASPLRS